MVNIRNFDKAQISEIPSPELIQIARGGITLPIFRKMTENSPLELEDWLELVTGNRSLGNMKKFNTSYSERILELAILFEKGIDVFGNPQKFSAWLHRNILALGGVSPKSLLDTTFGIRLVYNELGRIEHGILA